VEEEGYKAKFSRKKACLTLMFLKIQQKKKIAIAIEEDDSSGSDMSSEFSNDDAELESEEIEIEDVTEEVSQVQVASPQGRSPPAAVPPAAAAVAPAPAPAPAAPAAAPAPAPPMLACPDPSSDFSAWTQFLMAQLKVGIYSRDADAVVDAVGLKITSSRCS
jgi:hypothetical protein